MKEFKITKEQILELKNTLHKERVDYLLNEYFPDAFRTTLEVNKWYKDNNSKLLYFILEIKGANNINAYGFDAQGKYSESKSDYEWGTPDSYTEATDKEVETALIKEAKKRGYINKELFIKIDNTQYELEKEEGNYQLAFSLFFYQGALLMKDGVWATIIPTMTKQEAEEKLNCKIV